MVNGPVSQGVCTRNLAPRHPSWYLYLGQAEHTSLQQAERRWSGWRKPWAADPSDGATHVLLGISTRVDMSSTYLLNFCPTGNIPWRRQLRAAAIKRREHALAQGTQNNYDSINHLYSLFMSRHNLNVYNPSPVQLSEYIEYLAAAGYLPKTIRSHMTAIRRLHDQCGLRCDSLGHFSVVSHLKGIDKSLAYQIRQALSIGPAEVELLFASLRRKPGHQPFVFAITLAFTTFIRQANLAPPSLAAFSRLTHTMRRDIVHTTKGLGLVVFWTKTRQTARSQDIIPIPTLKGSPICPATSWASYQHFTDGAPSTGHCWLPNTPRHLLRPSAPSHCLSCDKSSNWQSMRTV